MRLGVGVAVLLASVAAASSGCQGSGGSSNAAGAGSEASNASAPASKSGTAGKSGLNGAPLGANSTRNDGTGGDPARVETEESAEFGAYFPKSDGDVQCTPHRAYEGFAQCTLTQGDKRLGAIVIRDLQKSGGNTDAYAKSTEQLAGFPLLEPGSTISSILVNNRYEVRVFSQSTDLTQAQRRAWIQKVDLQGLAARS